IACLFDECRRGPIGRHHDHRFYWNAVLFESRDSFVDVHGVALIIKPQDRIIVAPERSDGLGDACEARVSVRVLLGENRDLCWLQPLDLHQIVHHGGCFFCVTGPVVENISVGWIVPEQASAGEGSEKKHLVLKGVGQCDYRSGRSYVADYAENLVFLKKLFHSFSSPRGLVTVVRSDEPKLPAMHPTIRVGRSERSLDTSLHILAEFFGGAGKWRGNPKPDFAIGYTPNGIGNDLRFLSGRTRNWRWRRLLRLRDCGWRCASGNLDRACGRVAFPTPFVFCSTCGRFRSCTPHGFFG